MFTYLICVLFFSISLGPFQDIHLGWQIKSLNLNGKQNKCANYWKINWYGMVINFYFNFYALLNLCCHTFLQRLLIIQNLGYKVSRYLTMWCVMKTGMKGENANKKKKRDSIPSTGSDGMFLTMLIVRYEYNISFHLLLLAIWIIYEKF